MWHFSFCCVCWQLVTDRNKEKQTRLPSRKNWIIPDGTNHTLCPSVSPVLCAIALTFTHCIPLLWIEHHLRLTILWARLGFLSSESRYTFKNAPKTDLTPGQTQANSDLVYKSAATIRIIKRNNLMNPNATQVLCIISAINIQLCSVACLHICGRCNLWLDGGSHNSYWYYEAKKKKC